MLLSIIIPVHNREKIITRCLESLKKINESGVEFLIINDGSIDKTADICADYVQNDSRFHLINQDNAGVSGARNTGIEHCSGKYIAFVDSDDEITEEYNEIIRVIEKENYDLYTFDYVVQTNKDSRRQKRVLFVPGINDKDILYNNYLQGDSNNVWSNIYRAEIIKNNQLTFPAEMKMGEDSVFNGQYLKHCKNIYYIDEIGYVYYTDDQGSASYARKLSYLQDFVKIHEKYLEIYHLDDKLTYPSCTKYHINNIYGILKRHRKSMTKKEKIEFRRSHFCKDLLAQNYKSWKHEVKKWCVAVYVYFL